MTEEPEIDRPILKVVVFADTDPNLHDISFHLEPVWGNPADGKHRGDKIWFPKGKSRVQLKYILHDNTSHGLRFRGAPQTGVGGQQEAARAIYSLFGEDCPVLSVQEGIEPVSVSALELTFNNVGPDNGMPYKYQLNFTMSGGRSKEWDPIIKNGGSWP